MAKSEVCNFVRIVLAKLKGDDNEVVAIRNYKKASAALKAQIAVKEGELVSLQEKVEEAEERLQAASFPLDPIDDATQYIRTLVNAKEAVEDAKEKVDQVEETIAFFKDTLLSFE